MKFGKLVFSGLIFVLSLFSLVIFFFSQGTGKNQPQERFVIALDSTNETLINHLNEKEFLRSKILFKLILFFKGYQDRVSPGAYRISKSMNAFELADALVSGPYQKWVLIPPGKRKEQTALILKKELGWSEALTANFIQIAEEGYLFPDTYLIEVDSDARETFQKLRNNFNEKFTGQIQQDLLAQNIRNDTAIKVASLIERESGGDDDKAVIAGIIWNRLEKKMKLEIDATVQYAKASQILHPQADNLDEVGEWWSSVSPQDLRTISSDYNTYLFEGLPPGPICSPSLASIKAAVYPLETNALFYLHSADKKIHPANTYEEHLLNIEEYLR